MKNYITLLLLGATVMTYAQQNPSKNWMQYRTPSKVGFDESKLNEVKKLHQEMGGGALMVVYDGNIVLNSGNTSRKYMDHSMRKSYLSALFGIYVASGQIDLNETLESIGIDDVEPLTAEEKKATVADLLAARSGIYHASAYSPRGMKKYMPERGSHEHGTFWYYNNWDFNTLATIFAKKTGRDLFMAFNEKIAKPLGMQDFRLEDTYYRYEDISNHPAYLFRLSARDEARFGLLYANGGKWNGKQIIPASWVSKSTTPITTKMRGFENRAGYGYLWWAIQFENYTGYRASGTGGQTIAVFPKEKVVIVQSTDTYDGSKRIDDDKINVLMKMLLDARSGKAASKPKLAKVEDVSFDYPKFDLNTDLADVYVGDYMHKYLGKMSILKENNQLILKAGAGIFKLYPKSDTEFIPEDILFPLVMEKAANFEEKGKVVPQTNPDRSLVSIGFRY